MTPESIVDIFRHSLMISISIMSVLIIPGLIVGLLVATFQAATQINEASLSFIPKLFITFLVMILAGPWILRTIVSFTIKLISEIPYTIG